MSVKKTIKIDVDAKQAVSQVDELKQGVKGVDKSAIGAKKGLGGMSGATKMLGTAFKALGIGLVIAAFMKLKDIFSGNIETARAFERVSAQLSAAFDVIRDRAEQFIKSLIKLKNPLKAFREAFTGTTAEIREEAKAMGELTKALQEVRDEERDMLTVRSKANKLIAQSRLLAEDESKSMQERLIALKEAITEEKRVAEIELETQQKKVDAMQAVIDLGKSSETDMQELAQERARLTDLETASILKQKRVVTEIVTFEKQIATEQQKNANTRTKAAQKKVEQAEKDRELKEKEIEQIRVAGLTQHQLEIDQATTKYEALKALAEKNGLDTTEITQRYNEKILAINTKNEEQEEAEAAARQKEIDDANALADNLLSIASKKAADELAIQKAADQAKKVATIDAGQSILSSVGKLAGEGTKAAKAAAIASILINTASGISAAIAGASAAGAAAGPAAPIVTPLLIVQLVAQVLGGIAQAKAILGKVKGGGGGSVSTGGGGGGGGGGGLRGGGGMGANQLVPNMEAVTGGSEGEPGAVKSYVVEQDISSKQALQQELDTQATL